MDSSKATYTGFEFEVEGYPALAIINTDVKALPEKEKYTHSVFISITPDNYNRFGHPEGEEYDYLLEVEKKMITYLESEASCVHVGHTTIYRRREIIFYTAQPTVVEVYLEHFLETVERETSFEIEEDRDWNFVADFYEQL